MLLSTSDRGKVTVQSVSISDQTCYTQMNLLCRLVLPGCSLCKGGESKKQDGDERVEARFVSES